MQVDNEDFGRPVADYFGVSGDGPEVSLSYFLPPQFYFILFLDGRCGWEGGDLLYAYLQ